MFLIMSNKFNYWSEHDVRIKAFDSLTKVLDLYYGLGEYSILGSWKSQSEIIDIYAKFPADPSNSC